MDLGTFKDLCQRLDQLAAILEIMEDEPINVDLYREASDALNEAISEIERLRSNADLNHGTSNALRDALAEIERLQSETADLQHTKFAGGLSNRHSTDAGTTDWFTRFLAPIIRGSRRLAMQAQHISRVDGGGCCGTLATRW